MSEQVFYGRGYLLDMGITQPLHLFVDADNRRNDFLTFELQRNLL